MLLSNKKISVGYLLCAFLRLKMFVLGGDVNDRYG